MDYDSLDAVSRHCSVDHAVDLLALKPLSFDYGDIDNVKVSENSSVCCHSHASIEVECHVTPDSGWGLSDGG